MRDSNTITFSVADTGIGIATADETRIFEEFIQIENPLQKRVKGTGSGLPLCQKLAEFLGGIVAMKSTPGLGSTFFVNLPTVYLEAAEKDFEKPIEPPEKIPLPSANIGQNPPNSPPKILIVDGEEVFGYLLKDLLCEIDFIPIEAANGPEALLRAIEHQPQAIFLDTIMPDMTGFEVLEKLKSDPDTCQIPAIVLTSKHLTAAESKRLSAAAAIISKQNSGRPQAATQIRDVLIKAGINAIERYPLKL